MDAVRSKGQGTASIRRQTTNRRGTPRAALSAPEAERSLGASIAIAAMAIERLRPRLRQAQHAALLAVLVRVRESVEALWAELLGQREGSAVPVKPSPEGAMLPETSAALRLAFWRSARAALRTARAEGEHPARRFRVRRCARAVGEALGRLAREVDTQLRPSIVPVDPRQLRLDGFE